MVRGNGEPRQRVLARRILDTYGNPRSIERLWIHTWDHAWAFASRLAEEARWRGWQVRLTARTEQDWLRSILHGPRDALDRVPGELQSALRETDAYVFTLGPRRPIPWDTIPLGRRRSVSVWLDPRYDRSAYAREWSAIARARKVRMVGIEACLATPERARAFGLPYRKWADIMWAGCTADYRTIAGQARRLASILEGDGDVYVRGPGGTDLRFSLASRLAIVEDGLATTERAAQGIVTFLPSGSVEVAADEDSAEGTVVFDLPIRRSQAVVRGLRLRFQDGQVVSSRATRGGSTFAEYLHQGGAVGKFAFVGFGVNPSLEFGFTQDDKVRGGVTIGLGDNEGKGGRNRAKGAEWWGCLSNASVTIGRRTLMAGGTLRPPHR